MPPTQCSGVHIVELPIGQVGIGSKWKIPFPLSIQYRQCKGWNRDFTVIESDRHGWLGEMFDHRFEECPSIKWHSRKPAAFSRLNSNHPVESNSQTAQDEGFTF